MRSVLKIVALAFVAMCLTAAAASAEGAASGDPTELFAARWESAGVTVKILPRYAVDPDHDIVYRVIASHSDGQVRTVWRMTAHWDDGVGGLAYDCGAKVQTPVNGGDGAPQMTALWQDASGTLKLDGQGALRWLDSREADAGAWTFARAVAPPPSAEACLKQYLRPIAGMAPEDTTQAAQAAEAALRFAWRQETWNVPYDAAMDSLTAAWEALSPAEREAVESKLDGLMDVIDRAVEDYDSVAPTFDAAGVGDNMRKLAASVEAVCAWEALSSMTVALMDGGAAEADDAALAVG